MQYSTFIERVRFALGRPTESELSDADILAEAWTTQAPYRAKLNYTDEAWALASFDLEVPANNGTTEDEAMIPLPDFGTVYWIHTIDSGNPSHVRRTVDPVRLDQLSQYWSGPNQPTTWNYGSRHSALAFAPFCRNGVWMITWRPSHRESASYRVHCTTGSATMPPLYDDQVAFPIIEQEHFMIADCALNLFGQIADKEKGLNEQQKILAETAKKKTDQWLPIFEARRLDGPRREVTIRRKSFGSKRSSPTGGTY